MRAELREIPLQFLFVLFQTLHDGDQVGNQIVAPLELHIHLSPSLSHAVPQLHQTVVDHPDPRQSRGQRVAEHRQQIQRYTGGDIGVFGQIADHPPRYGQDAAEDQPAPKRPLIAAADLFLAASRDQK